MFSELFTGINSLIQGGKQRKEARKINPIDVTYTESPYAKMQLAQAEQALNGRMAGAANMENNLYKNQANSFNSISRAATPQQMIAAAGALQANTNNALDQLAQQEAQYKAQMLGNFNSALQTMTNEGDKVYSDQLRKYNRDYNYKQQLLNSASQNTQNGLAGLGGYMDSGVQLAMNVLAPGSGSLMNKGNSSSSVMPQNISNLGKTSDWNVSSNGGGTGGLGSLSGTAPVFNLNPYQGNGWFFNK